MRLVRFGDRCVVEHRAFASQSTRAQLLQLAKKNNVPVRCYVFTAADDTARQLAKANNAFEQSLSEFNKNFKAPHKREGFHSLKLINFIFDATLA
jgi:hypothetical protein